MNQKQIIGAVVIIAVIIAGVVVYTRSHKVDNSTENANTQSTESLDANTNVNDAASTDTNTNTNIQGDAPTKEPVAPDGNDVAVVEIDYDGKAFSPSTVTIKSGDVVVFKNNSTTSFWPASGPHPTHTLYPEFDPKQAIAAGQSWQFKFTKVGTWPFHNHLNPSATGTIIVK
ncbi:MAG TPA: cupredoxin domain-containing protein [Patescibacteria group bacterium]|jgi:plastocyanin|nr:cupredoxin domain-containing protein [Patescibacteria group bacterium]